MENRAFLYYVPVIDRYISESHVEHEDDIEIAAIWIPASWIQQQFIDCFTLFILAL